MKQGKPALDRSAVSRALALAALAIVVLEGGSSRVLIGVLGTAQASEMAAGRAPDPVTGSCQAAEFGPDGMPLFAVENPGDGEPAAQAPATAVGMDTADLTLAHGACSAAIPAPESMVAVVVTDDVLADGGGLSGAIEAGEAEGMSAALEPSHQIAMLEPGPDPAPEAAVAAPAESRVDAVPKPASVRKQRKPTKTFIVPEEADRAWWPEPASGKLNLLHAGQASFTAAIVLLFDGTFETPASANQNIQVKDDSGKAIRSQWTVATNRQMLLLNAAPGLYSIEVGSGLADKGGRSISASSSGLVAVR